MPGRGGSLALKSAERPLVGGNHAGVGRAAGSDGPSRGAGPYPRGVSEPLLERERELEVLRGALREAQEGHGPVVLVEGVAGLGKTSLLRASLDAAAEEGFTCLRARPTELERDFAYGCVRQLLEPVLARDPDRGRLFAGAAALAAPLFAATGAALPAPSLDSSFSMLHGLYWMIDNLAAETPVVLAVDDVQWADAESQRLLEYLAPRVDGVRLAVLASFQPPGAGVPGVRELPTMSAVGSGGQRSEPP